MYFLRSVKHVLTPPALKSIYYSLIHSHFVYGIHTWSCSNPGSISKLFLKQKMAIRIINNATFNAHTEPLFKKLNILPLSKLIDYFKLQFMHRFTLREIPSSFNNTWVKNEERRRQDERVLRNQNDFFSQLAFAVFSWITRSINGRHGKCLQQGTWGGGGARWYKGTERGNAGSARECTANSAAGVGKTPNSRAQLKPGFLLGY